MSFAASIPDYQPYLAGAFRWRLGLRPLDLDQWIEVDEYYDVDMARKRALMSEYPLTVNRAMDGTFAEGAEVLVSLREHMQARVPDLSTSSASNVDEHPLFRAGRMVQEDLALLVERDGELVFGAGSVCSPNRWDLASKIGLSLAQVHAPVARLNEQLEGPIDSFLERLTPDKAFWRLGWGLLETDEPYQPLDGTAPSAPTLPDVGDPSVADRLFLRVERETLRRFPQTRCVLFTIRTYVRPLRHLIERPEDALRLADALHNIPDDVREYKRTDQLTDAAVHWLTSAATAARSATAVSTTRRLK